MACATTHSAPDIFHTADFEHGSGKGRLRTRGTCHCRFTFEAVFKPHDDGMERAEKLGNAIGSFLRHLQAAGHAASSRQCYQGYLERLSELLGNKALWQISEHDLERAIVKLREDFTYSEVTLNKIRSIWRSFFQWSFKSGQLSINPAAGLSLAKTSSFPTIPITMDEVTTLLDAIRQSDSPYSARDELLFAIYAFTGIRRSEALSLRVSDYDAMAKTLYLRVTKGGGTRIQPVPTPLVEIVERYVSYLRQDQAGTDIFLFPGRRQHRPLSARQAQARFASWKRRSGIRANLTIHSFRAGFATILYRATGDIWLVARALGHSNVNSTRKYIETDVGEVQKAIEEAFFRPKAAEIACHSDGKGVLPVSFVPNICNHSFPRL